MDYFIDTHCHLARSEFDLDRGEVIARARAAGVRMLTVGTDLHDSRACVRLAREHPDVFAAVGIHPNDAAAVAAGDLEEVARLCREPGVVAVGEIGLDFFRDRCPRERQAEVFSAQLELALERGLPVLLHARDSGEELLAAVEPFAARGLRGVWHCFVAGKKKLRALMRRATDMGLLLGISGLVTFQEQKPLRSLVPEIPDRFLLLDTDSPFLSPRPRANGNRRNEPVNAARIARELAALRGVNLADIARITTRNACALLGLENPYREDEGKIAYRIRDALYLNLTNDCTNSCRFCARNREYVVKGHDIRLQREPTAREVIAAMGDTAGYAEVVFCGFGEPTLRLEVLKEVARELKTRGQRVRLNTNGLGNLYHERDIAPELQGLVDVVSVSLNTADPCEYHRMCNPRFGHASYQGLCEFVRACVAAGIETVCTVVAMPGIDLEAARARAAELGAGFRARGCVDVG